MKINLLSVGHSHLKVVFAIIFVLLSTMSYAQDKVYVSSQTNQITGFCALCFMQNGQNVVGSDENDYATMILPLGVSGRISQTLFFPATTKKITKVVIGIGSGNTVLSLQLLGGVSIETFMGNTSNNDATQVDNSMLKLAQGSNRGTVELVPKKPFDRVKITLASGILGLNDGLRIYYGYYLTACGMPPFDPVYYYSFNGNTEEAVSGLDLNSDPVHPGYPDVTPVYQDNMICNQGLGTASLTKEIKLFSPPVFPALNTGDYTISFWALPDRIQPTPPGERIPMINILAFGGNLKISSNFIAVNNSTNSYPNNHISNGLEHYVFVYSNNKTCLYLNGIPTDYCQEWNSVSMNILNNIRINIYRGKLDELAIYNKKLTDQEIMELTCSYGIAEFCHPYPKNLPLKTAVPEEVFTVSPNPTTGRINLDGNILLEQSEISISNISGKEVYHSKFRSKTIDLPATLPGGVYIVTLKTQAGKTYSRKVILSQ
ncbi:T9SS type A sorting domain-containing protein [Chryseobacterium gallinarum]|uniref:T9SS type A sorting domain-containing protein n=1 Tax=Chryseobacterium gallinarum TaxID=1324352 RepID=UPI0020243B92|nr:T9SS type A sorting domain-containing protein [Chryseobacterium gallinarum]MCL8538200.1 T9SS type A sorting domain-containing protein [Chryseobacterium gallinarum]